MVNAHSVLDIDLSDATKLLQEEYTKAKVSSRSHRGEVHKIALSSVYSSEMFTYHLFVCCGH